MNFKTFFILLPLLVAGLSTWAQETASCDSVYPNVALDQEPDYEGGVYETLTSQILIPEISRYVNEGGFPVSSLKMQITLNAQSQVAEVNYLRDLPPDLQKRLRQKIDSLDGWVPGKMNGQAVCSNLLVYISCLKWSR